MQQQEPKKNDTLQGLIMLALIIGGIYWYFSDSKPDLPYHLKYKDAKLQTLKDPTGYATIKKIAKDYTQEHNMTDYSKNLYDCLGQLVWEKEPTYTVNKMLEWCMIDYTQEKNATYYNIAELMSGFSPWDGSYRRLEETIKQNMNDPESYEHVKTTYQLVLYGTKRPHMALKTTFRGNNAFGAKVLNVATAKIDAVTYEGYDIEVN